MFCFRILLLFFCNLCQPNYLDFHWTDFHAVFTVQFRYGCRWTIWASIFEFSRDVAIATNFRSLKFRFFRRNCKTTPDKLMGWGKENVGNFAFCRMASVMTSGDSESQNCFQFVLLQVRFAQKVRDRLSRFSPAGRPTGVDDCCKIGLLSLKERCHRNKFVIFRHFPCDPDAIL